MLDFWFGPSVSPIQGHELTKWNGRKFLFSFCEILYFSLYFFWVKVEPRLRPATPTVRSTGQEKWSRRKLASTCANFLILGYRVLHALPSRKAIPIGVKDEKHARRFRSNRQKIVESVRSVLELSFFFLKVGAIAIKLAWIFTGREVF